MSSPTITAAPSSPPRDLSWQARAACRTADPELFSPISGAEPNLPGWAYEAKRRYCSHCPVVGHCRRYADALGINALGVWGGQWRHTPKCDSLDLTVTDIPQEREQPSRQPAELTAIQQAVFDAIRDTPIERCAISATSGLRGGQIDKATRALSARGLIARTPDRKWTRVAAGVQA